MEKFVYSVSELNLKVKSLLESDFSFCGIMVQGELTSFNKHYSGHYYFKLRDKNGSLISCIMFASSTRYAPSDLKDGDEVILTGSISVYDKGGTYSFQARKIEKSGLGKYLQDLKILEEKLAKEGLFSKPKKAMPLLAKRIGVVTSKEGAAVHDIVSSVKNNCPTEIIVFPCSVQGVLAAPSMCEALDKAYKSDCDLVILTRGGGSKDDLYAFNDESLVRKVFESPVPLITAVGHSIDTSLVDKVSDLVCITPTEAGQKASTSRVVIQDEIESLLKDAYLLINRKIDNYQTQLFSNMRLIDTLSPINRIKNYQDKNNEIKKNLSLVMKKNLENISILSKEIQRYLDLNKKNLLMYVKNINQNLTYLKNRINSSSPMNLLLKGYAFVYNIEGNIITSINDVALNDTLYLKLKDGVLDVQVSAKEQEK